LSNESAAGTGGYGRPVAVHRVEEQLGLKLDPERELVEVLIVDRLERPAEN